jgi:hypothetical protein
MLELLTPMSQLKINEETKVVSVPSTGIYKGLAPTTLRVRYPHFSLHTHSHISDIRISGSCVLGDKRTLANFFPYQVVAIRLMFRGGLYALCDDGQERYVPIPHLPQTQDPQCPPNLELYLLKGIKPPSSVMIE